MAIPLSDATKKSTKKDVSDFPMRKISAEIQRQRLSLEELEEFLTARSGLAFAVGKHEWTNDTLQEEWNYDLAIGRNRLNSLKMEPWRRWAGGFSCLLFVWVGIPLSIWMKSADHWTSFGTCFLPTLLIYYPVFTLGLDHARDGSWTPASVWLGNLALLAVGAWWMRRIYRIA